MFHILRWVVAAIALLGVFGYWFVNQPQMDPLMTPERKARIEASPHYVNGEFVPETPHEKVNPSLGFWKEFFFPTPGKTIPSDPMISVKTNLRQLPRDKDVLVWMGHSSYYMQLNGHRILIDPISAEYALPVPFVDKAFEVISTRPTIYRTTSTSWCSPTITGTTSTMTSSAPSSRRSNTS